MRIVDRRYDSLTFDEIRKIATDGPTELHCGADSLSDRELEMLSEIESLVALGFYSLYNEQLKAAMKSRHKIVALKMHGQDLSDRDLREVAKFENLRVLEVGCNDISDRGLAHLSKLEKLEDLAAGFNHLSGAGLAKWKSPLRELSLSELHQPFTVAAGEAVGAFSTLTSLQLSIVKLEPGALRPLSNLNNLRYLSLLGSKPVEQDLCFLSGLNSLEDVSLSLSDASDEGLEHLSAKETLVDLDLNGTKVSQPTFLGDFQQLKALNLQGTEVRDIAFLLKLPLVKLKLSGRWIDDVIAEQVIALQQLEKLELKRSSMTEQGLQALTQLPALHTLGIQKLELSDSMVSKLCELPALQTLHARGCRIKSRHSQVFESRRPNLKVIT